MENLTLLLKELAEKLGTTTEYLWGVLVRQALINGIIGLIHIAIIILAGIGLWKLHKKFMSDIPDSSCSYYDEYEGDLKIPMSIAVLVFFLLVLGSFLSLPEIASCFFNPEYWALEQVLESVKQ